MSKSIKGRAFHRSQEQCQIEWEKKEKADQKFIGNAFNKAEKHFKLDLLTPNRKVPVVRARRMVCLYLHKLEYSISSIARFLKQDHTSVLHSNLVIDFQIRAYETIATEYIQLENFLNNKNKNDGKDNGQGTMQPV